MAFAFGEMMGGTIKRAVRYDIRATKEFYGGRKAKKPLWKCPKAAMQGCYYNGLADCLAFI